MKAFFLDRDGTLILDKHYLADPAGVELIPGVPEALARFYTTPSVAMPAWKSSPSCLRRYSMISASVPEAPDQPSRYRKPSPRFIPESIARDGQ